MRSFSTLVTFIISICIFSSYVAFRVVTVQSIHHTSKIASVPTTPQPPSYLSDPPPSLSCPSKTPKLFCFLHALPDSSEIPLVRLHLLGLGGISSCDGYAVYSNVTNEILLGDNAVPGGVAYVGNARSRCVKESLKL
ncbi:hypothetical protein TL16_g04797 [Triparma laevis f. inornata]|uniref:Uncharacterized protein n=1 Tax=Triparma laevis f. inornata TaxID=1714386 RepID=A0A9W7A8Y7_9STRA|nr:hypothetical protein TL16_g04797 [Triparma laevis f. inornata]